MMKKILIQLDCDPQPSTFDAVVATDAGVDVLLRHGGVTRENVVPLVHGAMFTRGPTDLAATAIFVGGSDATAAEAVWATVAHTFFGPVRVGMMFDPNGANTTASAAVVAAARHLSVDDPKSAAGYRAVVLGGTGPVGQRVARLLARKGVRVGVASRSLERAAAVCAGIMAGVTGALVEPLEMPGAVRERSAIGGAVAAADLIIAAGAAGCTLLDATGRALAQHARVLIDLNAVPPTGIEGIVATDKARTDGAAVVYGALGVGGLKMKIHKAAIQRLFSAHDTVLDAEELLAIGEQL
jgi:methylenetetrahydrofolate/methylenetetrahydromethanopterin dehydrogenase (NADP+)